MNATEQSEYLLNRAWMWNKFQAKEEMIREISERGAMTEDECRTVKALCCMILADMEYERQVLTMVPGLN